ncbi:serpin B4-like isoform X1 [Vanessa atalanta]|uniref:serpin B4-like isoform X1 n=1 Tax=Vanessa atalanta TaxID=42275 RepID=UPI001FCE2926|nr:serpin B4-like isoform X1 [Vanessa atalanta]
MYRQTGKSWVSSTLGSYLLLSKFKNKNPQTKIYEQIEKVLRDTGQCKTESKIFYKDRNNLNEFNDVQDAIEIDNRNRENIMKDMSSILNNVNFKDFSIQILKPENKYILTNISTYKNKWNRIDNLSGSIMKVYNSFNYTEDIKYEARLLELPMPDDFKLVIITPNEVDVLCNLFNKLTSHGLTAAIGSIQPLFTSICELQAPHIKFSSTFDTLQHITNIDYNLAKAEYGNVKIDEKGVSIKVCTYMFPSNTRPRECSKLEFNNLKNTFFFGLIFKDTPIFTGQYVNVTKS